MVNNSAALDRGFLALASPVRRAIVDRLALGPATVGDAARGLAVSKPAHRLSLTDCALAGERAWLDRQRELWERKFDTVDEYLAERRRPQREEQA